MNAIQIPACVKHEMVYMPKWPDTNISFCSKFEIPASGTKVLICSYTQFSILWKEYKATATIKCAVISCVVTMTFWIGVVGRTWYDKVNGESTLEMARVCVLSWQFALAPASKHHCQCKQRDSLWDTRFSEYVLSNKNTLILTNYMVQYWCHSSIFKKKS